MIRNSILQSKNRGIFLHGKSLAIARIYGRKYGYIPTHRKSNALERIRRRELRPSFLAALGDIK